MKSLKVSFNSVDKVKEFVNSIYYNIEGPCFAFLWKIYH